MTTSLEVGGTGREVAQSPMGSCQHGCFRLAHKFRTLARLLRCPLPRGQKVEYKASHKISLGVLLLLLHPALCWCNADTGVQEGGVPQVPREERCHRCSDEGPRGSVRGAGASPKRRGLHQAVSRRIAGVGARAQQLLRLRPVTRQLVCSWAQLRIYNQRK